MSACRYLLARFVDPEMFDDAVDSFRQTLGVKRWDAVDGHYQMIVKLTDSGGLDTEKIRRDFNLQELVDLRAAEDSEPEAGIDRENSYSYLFIEADGERRNDAAAALKRLEHCYSVTLTEGKYSLVMLMKGGSFAELNRAIEAGVAPLDGILRFKQDRIISSNLV